MKPTRRHRVGRTLIEEFFEYGKVFVRVDGKASPLNFHQAIVAANQAPLIKMRDECRRLAREAHDLAETVRREDGIGIHDIDEIEHDDY